jgi:hypothetical protein
MRRIAVITALAAVATVVTLMLADGIIEIIAYELIVGALLVTAFFAVGPLRPERIIERTPITPSLIATNHPPQLQRIEWLVEFATTASADAELRLVPELRDLAATRLQERRQIDLYTDRIAAAAVIGEPAWTHLDPDRPRRFGRSALSADEVDVIVSAIEDL